MPELPEVETTLRGVMPWLVGHRLSQVNVRNASLRWPVELPSQLIGKEVLGATRRAKYLLVQFGSGTLIVHLGMSGSLRIVVGDEPLMTHDHVIFELEGPRGFHQLRFNDPRRFGCILWWPGADVEEHKLLRHLGPEPLGNEFSGAYLKQAAKGRSVAVKNFIMDGKVVVGVGNIYASEALFLAGVRPRVAAKRVSLGKYELLASAIRQVLGDSIRQGGTTLRDFVNADGQPGYFRQQLRVYGRTGEPCRVCETPIKQLTVGQRSTFYCPVCQSN